MPYSNDDIEWIRARCDSLPEDEGRDGWRALIKQILTDVAKSVCSSDPRTAHPFVVAVFLEDRIFPSLLKDCVGAPYDPARGAPDLLRLEFDVNKFRTKLTHMAQEFQSFCTSQG